MASKFEGATEQIRATGSKTDALTHDMNGLLRRMAVVADALRPALNTPVAGKAAQKAFLDADGVGHNLTATMFEVASALGITATTVEDQDSSSGAQVSAVLGGGSKVDTQF